MGLSTSLQQIATALLIAKRLKAEDPSLKVIIGGAIFIRDNAHQILREFHQVDYICCGEGEHTLRDLLSLNSFDLEKIKSIPNLVFRGAEGEILEGERKEMVNLSKLPLPDFSDYFSHSLRSRVLPFYPKITCETSRGCFYDKCHFCNLNAQWISRYRAKSDESVHQELQEQIKRYKTTRILFVDTNVSNRGALFKKLASDDIDYHIWAEVSGHLKLPTFINMRHAGVCDIQIGIESFSPHLLASFEKGVSVMRNMELLKWCSEYDMKVFYNLLINYPTETEEDERETTKISRFARYYQPPHLSSFMLTIDSPLEKALRASGNADKLKSKIPPFLSEMIPVGQRAALAPLLAPFVGVVPASNKVSWAELRKLKESWEEIYSRNQGQPGLVIRKGVEFYVLTDRTRLTDQYIILEGERALVYLACMQESRTMAEIIKETNLHEMEIELAIIELEQQGVLFSSEGRFLALAIWEDRLKAPMTYHVAAKEKKAQSKVPSETIVSVGPLTTTVSAQDADLLRTSSS